MNAATDPNILFQQAVSSHRQGNLAEASALYKKLIELSPQHPSAPAYLGMVEFQRGNLGEAVRYLKLSLQINPNQAEALSFLGTALQALNRTDEAVAAFDRALALKPDFVEVLANRGIALRGLGRLDEALASLDRAIALVPNAAGLHNHRGLALRELKRTDEALASFDLALSMEPSNVEVLNNRGLALQDLDRFDEALASFERAIAFKPDLATLHNNHGNALLHFKRAEDALASYDRAVALKPDYAEAYINRGNALQYLKRMDEAMASYDQAIALNPDYAEAYMNRGNAFHHLKRTDEALACYDRAIALKPDYAEAYVNRANLLKELKRLDDALPSYERALALNPDYEFLYGLHLYTRMQLCDWRDLENQRKQLEAKIQDGKKATEPFPALSASNSSALQRKAAEIYAQSKHPPSHELPDIPKRPRHDKIRIGYFSADFCNHPVSLLTAELFETHDKSKFELTAFSFDPDGGDDVTERLRVAFDKFIDVHDKTDKEIAMLAREMEIDIAVDMGGFTQGNRTDIFAMRAAPVQVNYLGYAGTMGAAYMDYMVADATVIPEESRRHYTEKIACLPSYLPHDGTRRIADRVFSRKELGLPKTGFVFCCFNNSYKITPDAFDAWARILKRVEGSVLWFSRLGKNAAGNLKNEAAKRGIDPERIIFAELMPLQEDHLARIRGADLFLDTLPYNAHASAADALWAGLPLLTCTGQTFAGRAATSLLNAIQMPELITSTPAEYEARAIELATNPAKLKEIREKLTRNRLTTPLFNTQQYTRNIESAYTAMYERYQAGRPPEHILVQP